MIGSKYEASKHLPMKDVAALVRKELKASFPAVTFKVRSGSTGMHGTLDIRVVAVPFKVLARTETSVYPWCARLTAEADKLLTAVEQVANAYNFDHSRSEEDYFHVRFYLSVELARELEQAERDAAAPVSNVVELKPAAPQVSDQERWMSFLGL